MPQTCSWWRSKPSFQSMEANKSFHRFQQASGKDLQGKEGKKTQTLALWSHPEAVRSLGSSRWSLWRCCVHAMGREWKSFIRETERASKYIRQWLLPPKWDACRWFFQEASETAWGFCCWTRLSAAQAEPLPLALSPAAAQGLARASRDDPAAAARPLQPWHPLASSQQEKLRNRHHRTNHRKHSLFWDRRDLLYSTRQRQWDTEEGCGFGTQVQMLCPCCATSLADLALNILVIHLRVHVLKYAIVRLFWKLLKCRMPWSFPPRQVPPAGKDNLVTESLIFSCHQLFISAKQAARAIFLPALL